MSPDSDRRRDGGTDIAGEREPSSMLQLRALRGIDVERFFSENHRWVAFEPVEIADNRWGWSQNGCPSRNCQDTGDPSLWARLRSGTTSQWLLSRHSGFSMESSVAAGHESAVAPVSGQPASWRSE